MSKSSQQLGLKQLDKTLSAFKPLEQTRPPQQGWLRAIRKVLGMSAKQLAERVGMTQPGIAQIENSEAEGRATLVTLKKVAAGLDCTLVYGFVPNTSLQEFARRQARDIAVRQLGAVSHSMSLEAQTVDDEQTALQIGLLSDEILATLPRHMWNRVDD